MRKLLTIALVAAGALATAACSGGSNDAATATTNIGSAIGNGVGDDGLTDNTVTAVDSDSAPGNGFDPSAVLPEAGNVTGADAAGNDSAAPGNAL